MSFTPFVIVLHLAASCVLYSLKCLCDENWQLQNVQHNFVETCDFVFLVVKIIVRLVVYFVANFVLNCEDSYENVSLFPVFYLQYRNASSFAVVRIYDRTFR